MNKNFKKIFFISLLVVFMIPQVTFAVWWNPFTWHWPWTKKVTSQEQVQQNINVTSEEEPLKEISLQEDKGVVISSAKTEEESSIPIKSTIPVIATPVIIQSPVSTPSAVVELSISDVSIEPESNSARISWKTSISSESKILLEGRSYFSKRGVGTTHYADIIGLESDLDYSGTITAIANSVWQNQNFDFTTKSTPLKITITKQSCPSDKCILSWETNYESIGRIKIYKANSNQTIKSINSPLENSREHNLEFKLEPNTKYTFEIYASTNTELIETTGQFETLTPIIPCSGHSCP